jgi:hypothetical protein
VLLVTAVAVAVVAAVAVAFLMLAAKAASSAFWTTKEGDDETADIDK